jgi:hypothetical protein
MLTRMVQSHATAAMSAVALTGTKGVTNSPRTLAPSDTPTDLEVSTKNRI